MSIRRVLSLALLLVVAVAFSAEGAPAKGKARPKKPEMPARSSPTYSDLDKDRDGRLALAEFKVGFPGLAEAEQKFKSLDTNGDGTLSISEYKAGYPDPIMPKTKKPAAKGKNAKPAAKNKKK
jgi:hypothetical protein